MKESRREELKDYLKIFVIGIVAAFMINTTIIVNATVPSGSMKDTIKPGDRIIGFRPAYLFAKPERGDIIIFKFPDDERQLFIKRVIGLPGEKIEIIGGKVYIDGAAEPLEENYVRGTPKGDFGPYEVPEGSYFVMGDNRNDSMDSRAWVHTFVKKEKILGKTMFRYYPKIKRVK